MSKFLWKYGLFFVFAAAVIIEVAFLGGAVLLAKTGASPQGWWVEELPAGSAGVVCVLGGSALAYGAATSTTMPIIIRITLLFCYFIQFSASTVTFPIYMYASSAGERGHGVPYREAMESLLNEGVSGWATLGLYFLIVCAIQVVLPGVLIASKYQADEKAATDLKQEVKARGEDPVVVINAIRDSAYGMLSRREVAALTDMKYNHVDRIVRSLVDEGVLVSDGKPRDAKFSLASE